METINMFKSLSVFITTIWVKPFNFFKRIKKGDAKKFFREQILGTQDSNLKMATAIGFGIFMGIMPIWGFQMMTAVFLAAIFRLNKAIVLLAANISIPPLIPFLLYISFLIGGVLLGHSTNIDFNKQFSFENIQSNLLQYYIGAVVFASIAGLFSGILSYFLLLVFRKNVETHT